MNFIKNKLTKLYPNALVALAVIFISCESKDAIIEVTESYHLQVQTDLGKQLIANSGIIAHVKHDTTYQVIAGVQASEISFVTDAGLAQKLFTFEIDLTQPNIAIEASTPNNSPAYNRQKMTEQAVYEDAEGHKVWAGINADFFNLTTGMPQGILYKEGMAIKTSVSDNVNTFFAILANGKAAIGNQDEFPALKNNIQEAVGGRVVLVSDGAIVNQTSAVAEPRTAIGVSQDGTKVYMLVVDGRRFHYSNGMSYTELAKCLKAMGAYDAINLDGGGSSTFFIRNSADFSADRFKLRNWPSDGAGVERTVANGLLIIAK